MEKEFNPNNVSQPNGNYFALPYCVEDSRLVLISAPFDVTTSYRPGSSAAPDAIIDASVQLDLYDIEYGTIYDRGIGTFPINEDILTDSVENRRNAERVIECLSEGGNPNDKSINKLVVKVNEASERVNAYTYKTSSELQDKGHIVGLVGGDHSTPFGHIKAVAERNPGMGVLHIDAHADLREAFEGFEYSHASIMYNVVNKIDAVSKLVQVGVRDFCEEEVEFINGNEKIRTFFDFHLSERKFDGESWGRICDSIVEILPESVYISLDIDGLKASYCPNTGTPVPGGLEYNEVVYLIHKLTRSGRRIVGFDINEVSPGCNNEWDANVGARLLYKLCMSTLSCDTIK